MRDEGSLYLLLLFSLTGLKNQVYKNMLHTTIRVSWPTISVCGESNSVYGFLILQKQEFAKPDLLTIPSAVTGF